MTEIDSAKLDFEFKRYLQIMRPYLGLLVEQDVIEICNAWIKRLSSCSESEKHARNKYVFTLCYQLAKGILDEPFLKFPPEELPQIAEEINSDSSTEIEYVVIDAEENSTRVLFNNQKPISSDLENISVDNDFEDVKKGDSSKDFDSSHRMTTPSNEKSTRKQTIMCYTCPEIMRDPLNDSVEEQYEYRATNLILKLREIKKQNVLLQDELLALKEESRNSPNEDLQEELEKVDDATSAMHNDSNVTLKSIKSLKFKLQEIQDIKGSLITTIGDLQSQLTNFEEIKKNEIEDMVAKHKLELIRIKTLTREESKEIYEDKLEDLKQKYEKEIYEIQRNNDIKLQSQIKIKDETIAEKDNVIQEKDIVIQNKNIEIASLKTQLEEQNNSLHSLLNKFIEKPNEDLNPESVKLKAQDLEKRLLKMEKSKAKYAKSYEAKLSFLQREKHLTECSLQLQLVRQRAQIVNEIADENQNELSTALDKLESKYKDIVANVQATAIQRRIQDQMTLEAILQAACGNGPAINSQISGKTATMRILKDPNQSYESDNSCLLHNSKIGKNNSSFVEDMTPRYCLDSEGLEELIQKVYIPQRDTGDAPMMK